MKRIFQGLLIAVAVMIAGSASAATIKNGPHDLSAFPGMTGTQSGEICIYCHTPHNAGTVFPLWNRSASGQSFTTYTSATMDMYIASIPATSQSRQCLSCHDGTTGMDSNVNNGLVDPNGTTIGAVNPNLGTDLTNDHPIGMAYDTSLDAAFNGIVAVTGDGVRLFGATNNVECPSCHDVHGANAGNFTRFLRISNTGSALCLACHIK